VRRAGHLAVPALLRIARILSILAGIAAPGVARAGDEPWFGKDKALHASISAAIAGGTYGVSAPFFDARHPPLLLGAGVSLSIGALKELHDLAGYGDPSWKDFTWDVIGTAGGLALAWTIDLLVRGVSPRHPLFLAPATPSGGAPEASSRGSFALAPGHLRGGGGPVMTWRWEL